MIAGPGAREPSLAIIRKYQAEDLVIPHWNLINRRNDWVVISMRPERWVWGDGLQA